MAQAACAAIDAMHFEGIVGTLAGDDTICTLPPELTQQLKSSLDKMLKRITHFQKGMVRYADKPSN